MKVRLKYWRIRRSMVIPELVEKSGVSNNKISAIERSGIVPSLKILEKLANALEVSIKDMLDEQQAETGPAGEPGLTEGWQQVMELLKECQPIAARLADKYPHRIPRSYSPSEEELKVAGKYATVLDFTKAYRRINMNLLVREANLSYRESRKLSELRKIIVTRQETS